MLDSVPSGVRLGSARGACCRVVGGMEPVRFKFYPVIRGTGRYRLVYS